MQYNTTDFLNAFKKKYPFEYEYWLSQTEISLKENSLIFKTNNQTVKDKFDKKLFQKIKEILKEIKYNLEPIITLEKNWNKQAKKIKIDASQTEIPVTKQKLQSSYRMKLNPKFTFERFIPGSNSDIAVKAAHLIANQDSDNYERYNPFFIHGQVGLGKTHLVQAIANEVSKKFQNKKIIYTTCENYLNHFIHCSKSKKYDEFRSFYRNTDILIIDDIQFLNSKEKIQDEIFNNFNQLHQENKQMIFTSDKHPKELKGIEERIISRFIWGLTVDIKIPDFETRKKIFSTKLKENHLILNEVVIEFLAENVAGNVREIESVVNRVSLIYEINQQITLQDLKEALKEFFTLSNLEKRKFTVNEIKEIVSEYYRIEIDAITSLRRDRKLIIPRQIAIYLVKNLTSLTLQEIGKEFGNREHSTLIASLKKLEEESKTNLSIKNDLEYLMKKIEFL